jgi:hypothetical protein
MRAWSLPNLPTSAPAAERVSDFVLSDARGELIASRKLAPGEYEAEGAASRFSYSLNLEPPASTSGAAHVSWRSADHGILFTRDLLPILNGAGHLSLTLPDGWHAISVEAQSARGYFEVRDVRRAVFIIGRNLRIRNARSGSIDVAYVTAGQWAFSDEEFAKDAGETLESYDRLTRVTRGLRVLVGLLPFQREVAGNLWSGETSGETVLLLSGRLPAKSAALAQLGDSLRHELFHIWVPNALALEGEYGWFYEGFTLYTALRTGMREGRLSFQDYLNAMGRAFDGYKAVRGGRELSLRETSEQRFTTNPALQYHKGMLVAFLYDLTLMRQTGGKTSLDDVYRELFRRHAGDQKTANGPNAIISVLASMPGMQEFSRKFIESPTQIDLNGEIGEFGLRVEPGGIRTQVAVMETINSQQRDLLRRLGYNDRRGGAYRRPS